MKKIIIFINFLIIIGCAPSYQVPSIQEKTPNQNQNQNQNQNHTQNADIKTLAILNFENNSVTDPSKYEPLTKGLSAMLITELQKNETALKLIEREKIQAVLKEIALSQSGSIDSSTAVQAGKMLGAQSIAFGSFMVLGTEVRIDTRIIKVETGEVVLADSVNGNSDEFIRLVVELSQKIATALNVTLNSDQVGSKSKIEAAILFSQGIQALDSGNNSLAKQLFDQCIEADPSFIDKIKNIKGL